MFDNLEGIYPYLVSPVNEDGSIREKVLRDLVKEIGAVAGKDVSKEKEDKIVNAILKDNVPKDLDKLI